MLTDTVTHFYKILLRLCRKHCTWNILGFFSPLTDESFFRSFLLITFVALFFSRCKVPYAPPLQNSAARYLVVEGYINGDGVTTIKLSRTRNITWGDTAAYINESNANVQVQDNQNNIYPLNNSNNGFYTGNYILSASNLYCLHITTPDNKEYVSDFVPFKTAPPIDSLNWKLVNNGVQVFVDTHDQQNKTRYYRWTYNETWEFHSAYNSIIKYDANNKKVVNRTEQVFQCWRTDSSTNILVGSSAKLQSDIIHNQPITYLPDHDRKISVLYSVLVKQYALDSAAYNYWQAIKGNTENVGSIFDPQPNQTKGNVHCVGDTSETVIGYVGAGTTTEQRLFISNSAMPAGWNLSLNCDEIEVTPDSIEIYFGMRGYFPIIKDSTPTGAVKGYFSSFGTCVECTLVGTNKKPVFWP